MLLLVLINKFFRSPKVRLFLQFLSFWGLVSTNLLLAQNATLTGIVKDAKTGKIMELANVYILEQQLGTISNKDGNFSLIIPAGIMHQVQISYLGYLTQKISIKLKPNEIKYLEISLKEHNNLSEVVIEDQLARTNNLIKINPKVSRVLPNPTGNFEMILQAFGARSNNELSSQYAVRGGNFDENLVYVNDFEIYRPLLARSGQQEGMSFINSAMVGNINFSAGGFEAKYGDKLSSVLDIRYKRPDTNAFSANVSLMGAMLNTEGISKNKKFSYLIGGRYRTINNLLASLDTRGEYQPTFADLQAWLTYRPNTKVEHGLLLNYAYNNYLLIPSDRETTFGTVKEALQLRVFFEGREINKFTTQTFGYSFRYQPNNKTQLKWLASFYNANEQENFNVDGAFFLNQLENDLGSDNFGKVAFNRGAGGYFNYARNQINATVFNLEHRGMRNITALNTMQWGVKWQREWVSDRLWEYNSIDSAGFNLPNRADTVIWMNEFINTQNFINSNRITAFAQSTFILDVERDILLTLGVRFGYWSFNQEVLFSPRAQFSFKPKWENDIVWRLSVGLYQQQPFYREMRNFLGMINTDIRAQKSAHFIAGLDYDFKAWDRPFKFVTEVYYKHLFDVIPYVIDNVRVRYLATNNATGYATGIDFRINGEFVNTLESYATISFMKTAENIFDDFFVNSQGETVFPGNIPRPTDQRFNLSLMFQDYLPSNPTYKVSLNLIYGSGLPFGAPNSPRYAQTFRIPPYRRVDIGFSKQIIGKEAKWRPQGFLAGVKSLWINAEVFNLLQVSNTISYLWIRDPSTGFQLGVPNYLTQRILNFRLAIDL